MSIENLLESFAEFEKTRLEYFKRAEDELRIALLGIFEKYPEIKAVCWTQFAPYFNDGDPCLFSVNEFYVSKEEVDPEETLSPYDEPWQEVGYRKYQKDPTLSEEEEEYLKSIHSFLQKNEDLLESLFESGLVLVTPSGIEVQEFEHH